MKPSKNQPRIGIIGAGISGIGAGRELLKNGFTNFVIFEASDRIGGRIRTIDFSWFSSCFLSSFLIYFSIFKM